MNKIAILSATTILMLLTSQWVFPQESTRSEDLLKFSALSAKEFQLQKEAAINYAREHNLPVTGESPDGRFFELLRIDEKGNPQYYITENTNSAQTISADNVHPGGSAGLSLTGAGITPREWDGGAVLLTHQEFGGRVVQGDGATTTSGHSTHVAGTIMAAGVSASAKGMAYQANLRSFEWNYDESEMAVEAAAGALMSNHSYGYIRGWYGTSTWYGDPSISTLEDYLFGFYDSQAQNWDLIAQNAPNYLIVKSAGNDRNEGPTNGAYPPDGPYDCIAHSGIAKNVLTVGAVNDIPGGYTGPSSVVMSTFSSWGPADDGRVKPDIVTNGVSLYSSYNSGNTSYASMSGTSMAAPSATGALALLQQYWSNLNGANNYMKSATLKGLVIHTADEAGTTAGPDYQFGWGLMDVEKAALRISEDQTLNVIDELSLSNGGTYLRTVYCDGTQPLKVTICWTDVPGTPVSPQLDPINPMLVNDLDLRLTSGASTYFPWKLDRNNPTNAATNSAENNVDNVEVVYLASPAAGNYTIVVDHDGTLSGSSQAFSIIISGITNGTPVAPVADFTANNTNPYVGNTVIFTDLSTNAPSSWNWSFNPSTVTYVGGTTSTSQNPQVTFNAAGTYDVTLVVANSTGSDDEVKLDYITVTAITPPNCSSPVAPANGATNVAVTTNLQWQAVANATGYYLYFGTDNPPTNLVNGTNLGNVTSYDPPNNLNTNATYYWKIVPYNTGGSATGCNVWSFTTIADQGYGVFPYLESFESGFGIWQQPTTDDFNWTRRSGAPPTTGTGPLKAAKGSYYLYTESTGQSVGNEAFLEAVFNFTALTKPSLSFYYHMYGNQMGSLHVDICVNGTWTNSIWSKSGQQQTSAKAPWKIATISLTNYAAGQGNVTIRFRGVTGGDRSDMAIDYIQLKQANKSRGYSPVNGEAIPVNEDILVYANNKDIHIVCENEDLSASQVKVYNIMGMLMLQEKLVNQNMNIIPTNLIPGYYIVQVTNDRTTKTAKVLIH